MNTRHQCQIDADILITAKTNIRDFRDLGISKSSCKSTGYNSNLFIQYSGKCKFWNLCNFSFQSCVTWQQLMSRKSWKFVQYLTGFGRWGCLNSDISKYGHLREKCLYFHKQTQCFKCDNIILQTYYPGTSLPNFTAFGYFIQWPSGIKYEKIAHLCPPRYISISLYVLYIFWATKTQN